MNNAGNDIETMKVQRAINQHLSKVLDSFQRLDYYDANRSSFNKTENDRIDFFNDSIGLVKYQKLFAHNPASLIRCYETCQQQNTSLIHIFHQSRHIDIKNLQTVSHTLEEHINRSYNLLSKLIECFENSHSYVCSHFKSHYKEHKNKNQSVVETTDFVKDLEQERFRKLKGAYETIYSTNHESGQQFTQRLQQLQHNHCDSILHHYNEILKTYKSSSRENKINSFHHNNLKIEAFGESLLLRGTDSINRDATLSSSSPSSSSSLYSLKKELMTTIFETNHSILLSMEDEYLLYIQELYQQIDTLQEVYMKLILSKQRLKQCNICTHHTPPLDRKTSSALCSFHHHHHHHELKLPPPSSLSSTESIQSNPHFNLSSSLYLPLPIPTTHKNNENVTDDVNKVNDSLLPSRYPLPPNNQSLSELQLGSTILNLCQSMNVEPLVIEEYLKLVLFH